MYPTNPDQPGQPLDEALQPDPATPEPEAEPEGTIDFRGQKMVPLAAVTGERQRRQELAARVKELEPLREKAARADQLERDLQAIRPEIESLRQTMTQPRHVEPQTPPPPTVTDAEAENYARRHQLYTADSKLDVTAAKSHLTEHKAELERVARETAERVTRETVGPVQAQTQQTAAKDNFLRVAATKDGQGRYVFQNPRAGKILIEEWQKLPPHLTAVPEVARVAMQNALGRIYLEQLSAPQGFNTREPVISEAPGGRTQGGAFTLTAKEREIAGHAGMTTKDYEASAKTFKHGQPNEL